MMEEEDLYEDIQKILEELPDNFNILEESIDIEEQIEYFENSKKLREQDIKRELPENYNELFLLPTSVERKREILVSLALVADVKAYRIIEDFVKEADESTRNWALLALQESRMLIKSTLLDEKQIFISTGLGGKGKKLRYYVVFISRQQGSVLTKTQQKLLKDELIFALKQENGDFESIDFSEGFAASLLLLPIKVNLKDFFNELVNECNQYGNFLEEDLILTNVKILSGSEIIDYINSAGDRGSVENDMKD
jgi:hypothetical protein